jgi:hypothetical protein
MGYAPPPAVDVAPTLRLGLRARLRAVREARMVSADARTRLAKHLEHAVAQADRPYTPFSAAVPVCGPAVHHARGVLLDLAERLRAPRRVDPEGVRLARRLLVDGAGPLYVPVRHADLRAAALRALRTLDEHGAGR